MIAKNLRTSVRLTHRFLTRVPYKAGSRCAAAPHRVLCGIFHGGLAVYGHLGYGTTIHSPACR